MKVSELIQKLSAMPQDLEVFAVSEHEDYTPIKCIDHLNDDEYGNGPHVQLSEYGFSAVDFSSLDD